MGILDIFDKFRDTIFLKEDSELQRKVDYLEKLKEKYPNSRNVSNQLYIAQKGLAGENEIAYQLKKANIGMYVLHDLNIQYEDLKAQIDFLVVTPWCCYFIECKNLLGNITVNENGDFIREYNYKGHKVKKGMESPYRQVEAQKEVYKKIWAKAKGKFISFIGDKSFEDYNRVLVVAANGENILNTKYAPKDIKYKTIKADALIRKLEYDMEHSDKSMWYSKKEMEQQAKNLLRLNVVKEDKFDININEDFDGENVEEIKNNDFSIKERLIGFRKKRSNEKNIPAYYVFNNEELDKILELMPKSIEELKKSKILTDVKVNSHGKEIVEIINTDL